MRKETSHMTKLIAATLRIVNWFAWPLVCVIDHHLSIAMAVIVPAATRTFVPCMVGTSLQAARPRNHFPP